MALDSGASVRKADTRMAARSVRAPNTNHNSLPARRSPLLGPKLSATISPTMSSYSDIPKYGFGTAFQLDYESQEKFTSSELHFNQLLAAAIRLGCRHFDCSPLYGTQAYVGDMIHSFCQASGIPRNQFYITSKLPVNMMSAHHTEASLKSTLDEMQLSYIDCFLIHAPFATKFISEDNIYPTDAEGNLMLEENDHILEECWQKMVEFKKKGVARYIGLSNVSLKQLHRLNRQHKVDVVQNEYHLFQQDREFFDYCEEAEIHFEAYAAFGCPPKSRQLNKPSCLSDPLVTKIAHEHKLTPAQVIIQWLHQQPLSYVIKTDNLEQLEENFKATLIKTSITLNEMIDLDSINQNQRLYTFDNLPAIRSHRQYPFRKSHNSPYFQPLADKHLPPSCRPFKGPAPEPKLSSQEKHQQQQNQDDKSKPLNTNTHSYLPELMNMVDSFPPLIPMGWPLQPGRIYASEIPPNFPKETFLYFEEDSPEEDSPRSQSSPIQMSDSEQNENASTSDQENKN